MFPKDQVLIFTIEHLVRSQQITQQYQVSQYLWILAKSEFMFLYVQCFKQIYLLESQQASYQGFQQGCL